LWSPRPGGRGFGFAQLKRSAGTHFPTAHLPFSSSFLIREVHCGKSAQSPAVMQKVRETAQQPLTPLLRKKQHHSFPASLFCLLLPQKNLGVVLTTDSFTHPLPMLHKPAKVLFPPHAPPKSLRWFGAHGLRPCKTATNMSDTIRQPVCTAPFLTPSSHHGTNCPAFSCHTSCIQWI